LTPEIEAKCRARFDRLDRQDLEAELAAFLDSDWTPAGFQGNWNNALLTWFKRQQDHRVEKGFSEVDPAHWDNRATQDDRDAHERRDWETARSEREGMNKARRRVGKGLLPDVPEFEIWRTEHDRKPAG
jgi:hypothetical protein